MLGLITDDDIAAETQDWQQSVNWLTDRQDTMLIHYLAATSTHSRPSNCVIHHQLQQQQQLWMNLNSLTTR